MRPTNFIGILVCLLALGIAYFLLERHMGLLPCPLCILDRVVLGVMALIFAAGLFAHSFKARMIATGANLFALSFGFLFAGRHVWMQNQPLDETRSCLSAMPEIGGLVELLSEAFKAEADCGLIRWQLFGLTIPGLTLLLFFGLLALLLLQGWMNFVDRNEHSAG